MAQWLTESSDSSGEQWHIISLTEMHTGNAIPFKTTFPALFLFLYIAAVF